MRPVHFKTARNAEDITEAEKSMALVDYWIIRLPLDIVRVVISLENNISLPHQGFPLLFLGWSGSC